MIPSETSRAWCLALLGAVLGGVPFAAAAEPDAEDDGQGTEDCPCQAIELSELSEEEALRLEQSLVRSIDDVDARFRLIVFYWRVSFSDATAAEKTRALQRRADHVTWLVRTHPDACILARPPASFVRFVEEAEFAQVRTAWLDVLEARPEDLAVIGVFASFLEGSLGEPDEIERLYRRAVELDPDSPLWHERLGALDLDRAREGGPTHDDSATEALRHYQDALDRVDCADQRWYLLRDVAEAALEAGGTDEASEYATELLDGVEQHSGSWNAGNALHHGHLILGRLALREGDAAAAGDHLLQAARIEGSPQLNSFGPNMSLARDLLEAGERDVVLEYLELCRDFWKSDSGALDRWKAEIEDGRIPDFGANLVY